MTANLFFIPPAMALVLPIPADRYALGLIAYALLSGVMPWPEETTAIRALTNKMMGQLVPLEEVRPGLPATLYAAVEQALELDPEARPASAADFIAGLSGGPTDAHGRVGSEPETEPAESAEPDADAEEEQGAAVSALPPAETTLAAAASETATASSLPEDTSVAKPRPAALNPLLALPPPVNGTAVIVLSVLSFMCGGVFLSIPAHIMARSAQSKIRSWEALSGGVHSEAGTVKAGFWVSAANIVLCVMVFLLYMLLFMVAVIAEL